jgi:hypothetical protein
VDEVADAMTTPTHIEFQAQIVELASVCGWRHLHVRRTIGRGKRWTTATNLKGWPDLTLMRPDVGWVPAELKIPPDKATEEQAELLAYLATLPATYPKLWTPADWGDIEATLSVRRRVA